jgi:1-acyl-sn-glycerol-3-phosphate acyltransferase
MRNETRRDATDVSCGRDPLVDAITMFLARDHASNLGQIRQHLERAIDDAGPGALAALSARLGGRADAWDYYPRDPLARRIHHALAEPVLRHHVVRGVEHLAGVTTRPLIILPNHLSYADANVLDFVLQQNGVGGLADRLTVIAGPKVYTDLRRRFSSLCFGTVKVPQSTARSSGEAVMTTREVARAARRALQVADERLRAGEALLVFGEGNRSRSGGLQRLLPGVARYFASDGVWLLPVGVTGTEKLFPIESDALSSVRLTIEFGRPVLASAVLTHAAHDRRLAVDIIGIAIARLLPENYRGAYGENPDLDRARVIADNLWRRHRPPTLAREPKL